jgi:hypothetical protein
MRKATLRWWLTWQTAFATSQFAAIQTQANDLAAASQSAIAPQIKH